MGVLLVCLHFAAIVCTAVGLRLCRKCTPSPCPSWRGDLLGNGSSWLGCISHFPKSSWNPCRVFKVRLLSYTSLEEWAEK